MNKIKTKRDIDQIASIRYNLIHKKFTFYIDNLIFYSVADQAILQ